MASRRETQATCSVVKRNSKSAGKLDGGGRIYLLIEYPGRLTGAAQRTTEEIEAIQGPQGIFSMRDLTAGISLQNVVFSPKDAVFQRDVGATFDAGCPRPPEGCLTKRQHQIWMALRMGASNKEIARMLGILESTVKAHLRSIYRELGVRNRTQAAMADLQTASDRTIVRRAGSQAERMG